MTQYITHDSFKKLQEEHSEVANEATHLSVQATEALRQATADYLSSTDTMKKIHKKEITERDSVIKGLIVSLLAVTACTIYLGIRVITNKC